MANRALALDANILIRAVPGNRVRRILEKHADSVSFFVPECARLSPDLLTANGVVDEYPILRPMWIWNPRRRTNSLW